jgi:hypothetical protein
LDQDLERIMTNGRIRLGWFYIPSGILLVILFVLLYRNNARGEEESGVPAPKRWFATLHFGIYTPNEFGKTIFFSPVETKDLYFLSLGISRELFRWKNFISLELEGQFAKHFGKEGRVSGFEEYVAAFNLRYQTFPWDKYLKNTLAIGEGYSYATEVINDETSVLSQKFAEEFPADVECRETL